MGWMLGLFLVDGHVYTAFIICRNIVVAYKTGLQSIAFHYFTLFLYFHEINRITILYLIFIRNVNALARFMGYIRSVTRDAIIVST